MIYNLLRSKKKNSISTAPSWTTPPRPCGAGGRDGVTFTPSMSDNGISIGNGLISALLRTGLKFDTEKKITLNKSVFVEYTDDEITNFYNAVII